MRNSTTLLLATVCLCALLHTTFAYYRYREEIPNGRIVPNPCESGTMWEGVGHQNPAGAGLRNPFGRDFGDAGHKWTAELCRRDSDGDGKTNGEELGDPDCVWTRGAAPARTTGISHPGVCPFDSSTCTNAWEVCPKKFSCPSFSQPGVFVRNFTIKETVVPPQETTYMCQAFELNATADATHMIGSLPIIKNRNVMHHMIMYACRNKPSANLFDAPQSCFMGNSGCDEILNIWAYGIEGECFNEKAGILVGGQGYQYAILELHWNNPEKLGTYKDSSGLSIYFTENLRQFNQGVLMYGELALALSPRQPEISVNHTCPGECTDYFHKETRYVTSAMIHMHEYGVRGRVSLWRNGTLVKDLVPMHKYDYNTPTVENFDPPIEFLKGDEVKTECYFSTMKTDKSVFWGFDTSEEMCFAFISYYPNEVTTPPERKLSQCAATGGINYCLVAKGGEHIEQDCNVTALRSGEAAESAIQAMKSKKCYSAGCHSECRDFLTSTMWPSNACFDPKRAKRMAEVLAVTWYLSSPTNESQKIMQNTQTALYGQQFCEQELEMLEQIRPTQPPLPTTSRGTEIPPQTPAPMVSQEMLVTILVCSCLSLLLGLLTLGLLLMRRHTVQHSSDGKGTFYDNQAMN